jgi:hypothetical protein
MTQETVTPAKTRYKWISWHQPTDDFRPLHFPPRDEVLGWWKSGNAPNATVGKRGSVVTRLVAMVAADDEKTAREVILHEWPEAEDWMFCCDHEEPFELEYSPYRDSPMWIRERFRKHRAYKNETKSEIET